MRPTHPARRRHGRPIAATLFAGATALALVACAPPGSDPEEEEGPDSEISTEVPGDEEINLVLTYYEDGGLGQAIEDLAAAYSEEHPNITIDTRHSSFEDYGRSIRLTMSSEAAPDIAQVGQGYVMMGPLVEAGLLQPLDAYAEAYGWQEQVPEGLLDQSRFQSDASSFGDGDLYGHALGGNMVGVFYNQALADDLGIDMEMETLEEFEAAMAAARDGDIAPIALGNLDGWPAGHVLAALMSRHQQETEMLDWIYGQDGATLDTPSAQAALADMQRWAQEGFILDAANGTSDPEAIANFIDGESLFLFSGNWNSAPIDDGLGEDAGFMLLPPVQSGDPQRAPGATTAPFGIHSESEHPDVAANFIDYMTSQDAVDILLEGDYAPLDPEVLDTDGAGTRADFNEAFTQVFEDDGLTLYLDWATVTMNDALFPSLQEMIGGNAEPADVIETAQADWETNRGTS